MSSNKTKLNEEILTRQDNRLSKEEIEILCDKISKKKREVRFGQALTNEMDSKNTYGTRLSLERLLYKTTSNIDLTVNVVAGSKTMPNDWDKDRVRQEVVKKKEEFKWESSTPTENNKNSGKSSATKKTGTTEKSPQNIESYKPNSPFWKNPFKSSAVDVDTNGLR